MFPRGLIRDAHYGGSAFRRQPSYSVKEVCPVCSAWVRASFSPLRAWRQTPHCRLSEMGNESKWRQVATHAGSTRLTRESNSRKSSCISIGVFLAEVADQSLRCREDTLLRARKDGRVKVEVRWRERRRRFREREREGESVIICPSTRARISCRNPSNRPEMGTYECRNKSGEQKCRNPRPDRTGRRGRSERRYSRSRSRSAWQR